MNSKLSTKKKILIAILTLIITGTVLIPCWVWLPENYFLLVLVTYLILLMIIEYVYKYFRNKKNDSA